MLRTLINTILSKIKGEKFYLDDRIPLTYLFGFFSGRFFSLLVGLLKLHRFAFVHPSSRIKCSTLITSGPNLSIDRNCFINALSIEGIVFGKNVSIGKNTCIECSGTLKDLGKGLVVGDNVGLGTHGFLGCAGGIVIGDNTILGNYVSMHSENHLFSDHNVPIRLQGVNRKGIVIGKDCWIGAKVTILDGTVIGDGAIIAAGAVVRGIVEPYTIVGGVPCHLLKKR